MPPISFWPPCRVPPDPPQANLLLGVRDAASHESPSHETCASCYGMCGHLIPPVGPPIDCPTSRRVWQCAWFFHRKANHFSLIRYSCGVLVTTKDVCGEKKKGRFLQRPREIIRHESGVRVSALVVSGAPREISGCKSERPRHRPPQDPTRHRITSSRLLLM